MPWIIDYKERKHLYIFSPVQLILSLEDYGTITVFANTWHTLDFPAGMRIYATNQSSPIYAYIKATDEPTLLDYNTVITSTITGPTSTPADGLANQASAVDTLAFLMGFNGTTWDRLRSFQQVLNVASDMYTYTHINANGTTTAKTGAGALGAITINNPGSSWTLTVYDNTTGSGTQIAVITPVAGLIIGLPYNVRFNTGLTIVAAGTTAGDVTIAWR